MRKALIVPLAIATGMLSFTLFGTPSATGRQTHAKNAFNNRFAPSGIHAFYPDVATARPRLPASVPAPSPDTLGCSHHATSNVRVSQDCTNQSSPGFEGRASSQNETAMAVNPRNPKNLLAGVNDYQGADGTCGAAFSLDGGRHWGSRLLPMHFSAPGFTAARHYWNASGDPSVAFDSRGEAYFMCGAFDRGPAVGDGEDNASGLFVFRSHDGGASWSFPASRVIASPGDGSDGIGLLDKQYMALDNNPTSPFANRIYVTWTQYSPAFNASPIHLAWSADHGNSWHLTGAISGSSASLCPITFSGAPAGTCDADQFSDPFVGPDGDVYVAFQNFNNCAGAFGSPCTGDPKDNHNQILIVKSTDGGNTFGRPVKVADFYDLPDCVTYTGQDAGRACVPTAPLSDVSIFRAENYPAGVAAGEDRIVVTLGSYINEHSNPARGNCAPDGFAPTGLNAYKGVGVVDGCNNDIVRSISTNGGASFTGTTHDVSTLPSLGSEGEHLTDQWWQWAAMGPSGKVAVSYYDRKYGSDQKTGFMDITLVHGHRHVRVTNRSLPPSNEFPAPNGYSLFIGDYSGLAVGSDGVAHPVWSDTRNPIFIFDPTPGADPRPLVFAGYGSDGYTRAVALQ